MVHDLENIGDTELLFTTLECPVSKALTLDTRSLQIFAMMIGSAASEIAVIAPYDHRSGAMGSESQ
jgi:hypothetical protein